MRVRISLFSLFACSTWLLSGCGQPPPATFVLNEKTTGTLIPEAQEKVKAALTEYFGTPNQLVGWQKFPIDYGISQPNVKGHEQAGWRLKEGRNHYMQHCLHCHGVSGDGNGPTATFLNPRPRDYRQGKFKFKSTQAPIRPAHSDLVRILKEGIPGTYMPSFVLLGDEKLGLIVDYVRWLSMRGEFENGLYSAMAAAGATSPDIDAAVEDLKRKAEEEGKRVSTAELRKTARSEILKRISDELAESIEQSATDVAESWTKADQPASIITPAIKRTLPTHDSIERGKKLYLSQVQGKKTQCADCHGPTGRGNGPNTELFWPIVGSKPERKYEEVGLHDEWGQAQKPRDLTRGIYRGGRRPIDIYRRIFAGIPGTQMPSFGGTVLKDDEIWDVVNYVLSIPFDGKESPHPTNVAEDEGVKVAGAVQADR